MHIKASTLKTFFTTTDMHHLLFDWFDVEHFFTMNFMQCICARFVLSEISFIRNKNKKKLFLCKNCTHIIHKPALIQFVGSRILWVCFWFWMHEILWQVFKRLDKPWSQIFFIFQNDIMKFDIDLMDNDNYHEMVFHRNSIKRFVFFIAHNVFNRLFIIFFYFSFSQKFLWFCVKRW